MELFLNVRGVGVNIVKKFTALVGRLCIGGVFVGAAAHKIIHWNDAILYGHTTLSKWQLVFTGDVTWSRIIESLTHYLPFFLGVALFFELGGGLLLFLGVKVRLAVCMLLLFLVPVTVACHPFWQFMSPERDLQVTLFFQNVAIAGGLITILAFGTGPRREEPSLTVE